MFGTYMMRMEEMIKVLYVEKAEGKDKDIII